PSRARPDAEAGAAPGDRARVRFVLIAAGVTGFAFLLLELVWYRMLSPLLGGSTYTFGLILTIALLGIGLGGFVYTAVPRRTPPPPPPRPAPPRAGRLRQPRRPPRPPPQAGRLRPTRPARGAGHRGPLRPRRSHRHLPPVGARLRAPGPRGPRGGLERGH